MKDRITEPWLQSIGFYGGANRFGPSCGRTWTKDGLRLDCYDEGGGNLSAWCELQRGEVFTEQWQIVHLCSKNNVPLVGVI